MSVDAKLLGDMCRVFMASTETTNWPGTKHMQAILEFLEANGWRPPRPQLFIGDQLTLRGPNGKIVAMLHLTPPPVADPK